MAYILNWEDKGVYWKYTGKVTGKEIIDGSTAIYGARKFDTLKYKLVDFLDVECIRMNKDEVDLIAYQHRAAERANPYIKNAIVVKSDNKLVNRFVSFFSKSSWDVRVFHDIDEATKWLGRVLD